jgi:putative DNA primase/helicase
MSAEPFSKAEAMVERITAEVKNYQSGLGPDLEEEHLALAEQARLDVEPIRTAWQKVKGERRAKAAPLADTSKPAPAPAPSLLGSAVCLEQKVIKPVAMPGPPAAAIGLNRNAPKTSAAIMIERKFRREGITILRFWQGEFWWWNECVYAAVSDDEMKKLVSDFLGGATKSHAEAFNPKQRDIDEVLAALKNETLLSPEYQPPIWLDTFEAATEWIVFRNVAVNALTGEVREVSPLLWLHGALPFDWKPEAECPGWIKFLEGLFPNNPQSHDLIEEWAGYCMTEDNRFDKSLMMVGKKRSGKTTLERVFCMLVGDKLSVGLSFNAWLKGEKSLEPSSTSALGFLAMCGFRRGECMAKLSSRAGSMKRQRKCI